MIGDHLIGATQPSFAQAANCPGSEQTSQTIGVFIRQSKRQAIVTGILAAAYDSGSELVGALDYQRSMTPSKSQTRLEYPHSLSYQFSART